MAKFTAGPDAPIDFLAFDVHDLGEGSLAAGTTATHHRREVLTDDYTDFFGAGFTYNGDTVIGGTINRIVAFENDQLWDLSRLSIFAATANDFIGNGDSQGFLGAVFAGNDAITGSLLADRLLGEAGRDVLTGSDGDDTLDGGEGIDRMIGGRGNDTYVVDETRDVIAETFTVATGGVDLVQSSASYVLRANLDDLQLTGLDGLKGTGNTLANDLAGNTGNNHLLGMSGNDALTGGAGNDTLDGGRDADEMDGGAGDDLYIQDDPDDKISESGASLGDELRTKVLAPALVPGIEHYTFTATKSIAFTGDGEANHLTGTNAADTLDGAGGDDTLSGLRGNDALTGGEGNDSIVGGTGADSMEGGAGDDVYGVDNAGDTIADSGGANDKVESTQAVDLTLEKFKGIEHAAVLGRGALALSGNAGGNILTGNDGANRIDGRAGADAMAGGKGNDIYTVDNAGGTVAEAPGEGTDTVLSSVDFALGANLENLTLTGAIAFTGEGNELNNVITGAAEDDSLSGAGGNDTLTGNDGNDTLDGGEGIDRMVGGKGDDLYIVDESKDVVSETFTLATGGSDIVQSSASFVLGANLEDLELTGSGNSKGTGNTLANMLTGNTGDNHLLGMTGDDTLTGGDGDDTLDGGAGADSMTGGDGDDFYIQDNIGDAISETGTTFGDKLQTNQSTLAGTLAGIEHYVFTGAKAFAFTGGDTADNSITGTNAADSLDGAGGNDTLSGLGGNDTLIGGAGNDSIVGGAGADNMQGGAGDDVYGVDSAGDTITDSDGANDKVESTQAVDLILPKFAGIEHAAVLGSGALALSGNDDGNILTGNAGANKIDGRGGADEMAGGKGNDIYTVDDSGDTIAEAANEGTDSVLSSVDFALGADVENLTLSGAADKGDGNDLKNVITGGALDDSLSGASGNDTLTGNDGNDTLDGGEGIDRLVGGKGDDTYIVDDAKDVISETLTIATGGTDLVKSSASYVLGGNLDKLELTGTEGLKGTGNTLANDILGNTGDNHLLGMTGDDTLTGGAGNDILDGGAGIDKMTGGEGDDLYVQDNIGDTIIEDGSSAGDELKTNQQLFALVDKIEHYTFTGTKGVIFEGRNAEANRLTGTNAADMLAGLGGDDTLIGLGGNDRLDGGDGVDSLDGGIGNDTMIGGKGDDMYVVSATTDVVDEAVGEGNDTVQSTVTYSLAAAAAAGIENLTLLGKSAIHVTGNGGANVIAGNDGANKIDGGGADTLIGGKGNDIYTVDDGDVVTELAGEGTDLVNSSVDFVLGDHFENLTLTGASGRVGTGNDLANAIVGTSGDDALFGKDGNDTLTGNDGKDTLDGGAGIDKLVGGRGDDVYLVDDVKDVISETLALASGGGKDTVKIASDYALGTNLDNLEMLDGAVKGTGNILGNVITGNSADNIIDGAGGFDTIDGGGGNDTVLAGDGGDVIVGGTGEDVVIFRAPPPNTTSTSRPASFSISR